MSRVECIWKAGYSFQGETTCAAFGMGRVSSILNGRTPFWWTGWRVDWAEMGCGRRRLVL